MKWILALLLLSLAMPARGQQAADTGPRDVPSTLQPLRIPVGGDTLFAYTREQNRHILVLLTEGRYDKAELRLRERQVDTLTSQARGRAVIISALQELLQISDQRLKAKDSVIARQEELLAMHDQMQQSLYKKASKDRFLKKLLFAGILLAFLLGVRLKL